jgi:hypothetical protein
MWLKFYDDRWFRFAFVVKAKAESFELASPDFHCAGHLFTFVKNSLVLHAAAPR